MIVEPPYAPGEVLAVGEELVFAHFGDGHQEPLESSLDYASDGAGIAHWIQCGKPPWNWSESWVGSVPWHELADEEDEDWIPADRMPLEAARLWVRVESVEPMTGYDTPVGTISTTLPGDDLEGWACTLTPCNKDGGETVIWKHREMPPEIRAQMRTSLVKDLIFWIVMLSIGSAVLVVLGEL